MRLRKRNIIILLILLLLTVTALGFAYSRSVWRAERAVSSLLRQIERGNINDITLTIYYELPASGWFPTSVDSLISHLHHYRIVIDGVQLEEHLDVFNRFHSINLVSVRRRTPLDASIYYVFEDSNNRKIFDVAMFGSGGRGEGLGGASIFVNGIEVEWNDIFIEIMLPFLPENRAKAWERSLGR